jgi:hypothetical protein
MAGSSVIFGFLLLAGLAIAQSNMPKDPNNHFVYPPTPGPKFANDPTVFKDNKNFTVRVKQSQPFTSVTNMTLVSVTLWQEGKS